MFGLHLLRWMFSSKTWTILQRTLLGYSVDLNQCEMGKTVVGFWIALWISEHKKAHLHFVVYRCPSKNVLLFIMSKKHPRYNRCWTIIWFVVYHACVCVCVCEWEVSWKDQLYVFLWPSCVNSCCLYMDCLTWEIHTVQCAASFTTCQFITLISDSSQCSFQPIFFLNSSAFTKPPTFIAK